MDTTPSDVDQKVGTARGSALRLLGIVLQTGFNLALVPLSLFFLGDQRYGIWIVIRTVGIYLIVAADIGIGQSVVNFGGVAFARADRLGFRRILATAFAVYCGLAAMVWLGLLIVVILAPLESLLLGEPAGTHPEIGPLLLTYGTLALTSVPLTVFPAGLLGLREVPLRHFAEMAAQPAFFLLAALPLFAGLGLAGITIGSGFALLVLPIAAAIAIRRRHPWAIPGFSDISLPLVGTLIGNSLLFIAIALAPMVQRTAGTLVLSQRGDLSEVPVMFTLILLFRVFAWTLLDLVTRVAQPYVILMVERSQRERVESFVALSTKLTALGATSIVCVALGIGPWASTNMLHIRIDWWLFFLLGSSLILDASFIPALNVMIALNRQRELALSQILYSAVALACAAGGAILLPEQPLVGIAIGLLVSALAQLLVIPWLVIRALDHSREDYVLGSVARPLALSFALLAAVAVGHSLVLGIDLILGLSSLAIVATAYWFAILDATERTTTLRVSRDVLSVGLMRR